MIVPVMGPYTGEAELYPLSYPYLAQVRYKACGAEIHQIWRVPILCSD
jgi:hypothetical protein